MPHASSIIPIGSFFPSITLISLYLIGFGIFLCFLALLFSTNKKNWYKSIRDAFFPPLAILAFLFSVLITISYHNRCIENKIYDQLNEIYHKKNPTTYEQIYFEIELNALKTLEEHNELSLCANYNFHYNSDPLDKIFPYYNPSE